MIALYVVLIIIALLLMSAVKIFKEYERGVVFTLGRFWKVKGPGLVIILPMIQTVTRIELRTIVMDIPSQDVISRDNVSVKVNAVLYFRVVDPEKAIIQIQDYIEATSQLAQTTLRSVLGEHELDEMLTQRETLSKNIQTIVDKATDGWGIKVSNVEIKHVDLEGKMVRAIARQAEAERERRAKVINAQGELQSAGKLQEAAEILSKQPNAIQLRYLQTLMDIANERTNTIVFPVPLNMLEDLIKKKDN
ncbi:MAG: hypothetical protein COB66_06410 [Coxiella sp. (in: Bacteria)]|nr:MAG: hypothetical protein COB66_06410 [Coxiella sp. (in: g-proteobacteria)]